jgi:DNA-3-methyladenine glycosylase I
VAPGHSIHGPYHDREYGFPQRDEAVLFERLALEIFQAGLSWLIVLKKRAGIHRAFAGFAVDRVARFGAAEAEALVADPAIIRNRRKIAAVIENARRLETLRASHSSFAAWLDHHHPASAERWLDLFRGTFVFMGREVVGEFLLSTGYLPGAHRPDCPTYVQIMASQPPWARGA